MSQDLTVLTRKKENPCRGRSTVPALRQKLYCNDIRRVLNEGCIIDA
jgi:hypothetical protein